MRGCVVKILCERRIIELMKEMRAILQLLESGAGPFALVSLVGLEGSSYRRLGAMMLIDSSGRWAGGISGGCLEGDALRHAQKVIHDGQPRRVCYDTRLEAGRQIGVGLGCEGKIEVFFRLVEEPQALMDRLQALMTSRQHTLWLTPYRLDFHDKKEAHREGELLVYYETALRPERRGELPESILGQLPPSAEGAFTRPLTIRLPGAELHCLAEHIRPNLRLFVLGEQRDVYPLVNMAATLGWDTALVGRAVKYDRAAFPSATSLLSPAAFEKIAPDDYTIVVAMHHDYDRDMEALRRFALAGKGLMSMLGPRRRFERMVEELGLDPSRLHAVKSPAGLDLGANTPQEIAVAILSECIAHFNGGSIMPLSDKKGPIHHRTGPDNDLT